MLLQMTVVRFQCKREKMIDFHCSTKAERKEGCSTCDANSDILNMRLFASIHQNLFFCSDGEVNSYNRKSIINALVKRKSLSGITERNYEIHELHSHLCIDLRTKEKGMN